MELDARMNAATYPEADHSAPASPAIASVPAARESLSRLRRLSVRICRTGPGATPVRLSISGWMADCPIRPSTEASSTRPGKIDSTP